MAVVVLYPGSYGSEEGRVFVFKKRGFNSIRKHIFLDTGDKRLRVLKENALGYREIPHYREYFSVRTEQGRHLAHIRVESLKRGVTEIVFPSGDKTTSPKMQLWYLALLCTSFTLLGGSMGGICDYTQRVVFHETRSFSYLFRAIERSFFKSLCISFFIFMVVAAIAANVYFYIFIISNGLSVFIAALNIWMFLFFVFILFWVYPILVLNREESIWKVMKKS
ncbi:MAG: hypothetical protein ACOC7U_07105, partial [Spirochaetota bacterium]